MNACGFLLQWMNSKSKNNKLHTLHRQKSYKGLWKARFFTLCPNYWTKPHLDFNFSYLLHVLLVRKIATI